MKKVLVLGYFGYKTNQLDGQTVKTRNILNLLKTTDNEVTYYDTQEFKYDRLSILRMFTLVCQSDFICYLPAHNNLKYIFPIVFILSKLFGNTLLYFVVGGWLVEFLQNLPLHRWMLKHIKAIFPETKMMCECLSSNYGITRTHVFPNFRITNYIPPQSSVSTGPLRLLFMARINKQKGYESVFSLVSYAMEVGMNISVDFYGPINNDDYQDFNERLACCPTAKYKGVLNPDEIYTVLSQYDLMLLPTRYYTEGFPGSILDAYIAGIPVIVTEWKHAREFVLDGKTGYVVPFDSFQDAINSKVEFLYYNRQVLQRMKDDSREYSKEFQSYRALQIIADYIV